MLSESSQDIRKDKIDGARTSPSREDGLGAGTIKNHPRPKTHAKKLAAAA
jgi:hypothetical protein